MTRKEAREFMMQVFFQMEACGDFDVNSRPEYMNTKKLGHQKDYCNELHSLLCNKKDILDEKLNRYSVNWKTERLPKTDLAVLRLAACEILYMDDMPDAVSINEAVELSKKYGTESSAKYVNGILGKIAEEKNSGAAVCAGSEDTDA